MFDQVLDANFCCEPVVANASSLLSTYIVQTHRRSINTDQCSLGTGHVGTAGGRLTQSLCAIVQMYLPGGAYVHTHLLHDCLGRLHSPSQAAVE